MEELNYEVDDKIFILPKEQIAIISDLHLSGEMSKRDIQFIENSIYRTLKDHKIRFIVFNGDTFNEFPFPDAGIHMIERLRSDFEEVILLEGNHERKVGGLGKLEDENNTELVLKANGDTVCISHGDTLPETDADIHIIGHIHPSKSVNGEFRPCLLESIQNNYKVIILPSYTKTRNIDYSNQTSNTPLIENLAQCTAKHIF